MGGLVLGCAVSSDIFFWGYGMGLERGVRVVHLAVSQIHFKLWLFCNWESPAVSPRFTELPVVLLFNLS